MAVRTDRRRRPVARRTDPRLWLLAVVLFGAGDVATTAAGFGVGLLEMNPLARHLILDHGLVAMVVLKLLSLACCGVLWTIVPRPHRVGVPLGLVIVGGTVTTWNALLVTLTVLS